ncbi:hypothetical protein BCR33DRAFT_714530, partial [Rhizoclosmatium globosum]
MAHFLPRLNLIGSQRIRRVFPQLLSGLGLVGGVVSVSVFGTRTANFDANPTSTATATSAFSIEAATQTPVPNQIGGKELVGFGVRHVTLLRFNVYVAALYADAASLNAIKKSQHWRQNYSPAKLLNGDEDSFYMKDFVRRPNAELTLSIEPVRATTGPHLRQGFTRFLNGRVAKDIKDGAFANEADQRAAEDAVKELEAKFPSGNIPKNARMFFTKTAKGELRVEYEDRELAVIKSKWLSERFFEGYLAHEKPISEDFRKSVADGLNSLSSH